jgi:hypothetical protein
MSTKIENNENKFIDKLKEKLNIVYPNYKVYVNKKFGRLTPDMTIDRKNDKVIIEVKDAKSYSSLPFSTLLTLEDFKSNIPDHKLILVSFSNINDLMKSKLDELGIKTYIKPDFENLVEELKE